MKQCVSHVEKWITLETVGHTWKNEQGLEKGVSHLPKWVTLRKIGHITKKWFTLGKMGHISSWSYIISAAVVKLAA